MSDDLELNSIDRFRKRSDRLILEAHTHCEVPAGCGGVVLRSRRPNAGVYATIREFAPGTAAWFIDGVAVEHSRVELTPGQHVLALRLDEVEDLTAGLLLFVASYDPKDFAPHGPSEMQESAWRLVSAGDGTWKFTLDEPDPDSWKNLSFNDTAWAALIAVSSPQLAQDNRGFYSLQRCQEAGASCLGIPGERFPLWQRVLGMKPRGRVWVRKAFAIPAVPEVPSS